MKFGFIIILIIAVAFVAWGALTGWRIAGDGNMSATSNTVKRLSGGKPTMSMPPADHIRPHNSEQAAPDDPVQRP